VILFAGLVALAVHAYISDCLKRRRHLKTLRRVVPAAVAVGGVLFLAGAYGVFRPLPFHTHYLFTPLSVALGIVLLVYGGYVFAALLSPRSASASERWFAPGPVAIGLVSMLVVLSLFWAASAYAAALGRGRAEILETGLSERPGVIVYSKERLGLTGPGVVEEELPGARSAFHFRYEGLRLLIRSDDKYFLLPDGWTRSNGTAIVLPDSSGLRFEFTVGQ
jgi:hypothetical protein